MINKKRILILGKNSYVGCSFKKYIDEHFYDIFEIDSFSARYDQWKKIDFSKYYSVFNCVGIAHVKETSKNREMYYKVNRDLSIELAEKSKKEGVKQFIFLSSMSVYGKDIGHISKRDEPNPVSAYGKSKLEADKYINNLSCNSFSVACIRPPMIYGKNCKGNYQTLRKLALTMPMFPSIDNERSMIYIDNLCDFIRNLIEGGQAGLFLPQNKLYVHTREMVELIAKENGKNIHFSGIANPVLRTVPLSKIKKAFGSLTYERCDLVDKYSFEESLRFTEN